MLSRTMSRLLNLTTTLHRVLPREIRNMVYTHVLNTIEAFDFVGLASTLNPSYANGIHEGDGTIAKNGWPRIIDSRAVYLGFARELIETFYHGYKDFAVLDARKISQVMRTDHFNLDIRPRDCVLSALAVCIRLAGDYDGSWNTKDGSHLLPACVDPRKAKFVHPNDFATCFAPLFSDRQRLAPGFKLTVYLHAEWRPRHWHDSVHNTQEQKYHSSMEDLAKALSSALQACRSVVLHMKERRCAEVQVVVGMGGKAEMVMKEGDLCMDAEGWLERFERDAKFAW
jgi:hypothetical protein